MVDPVPAVYRAFHLSVPNVPAVPNVPTVQAVPGECTGYTEWAALPKCTERPGCPSVPSLARMVAVKRLFFSP